MASIFDKIVDKQGGARKSASWYRNAINQIATPITAKRLMREKKLIGRPSAGRLNMFFYDPKFKETLPLYDTFPLVLPLEPIKGGFLGMNFHYLPYMIRLNILKEFEKYATTKVVAVKSTSNPVKEWLLEYCKHFHQPSPAPRLSSHLVTWSPLA